MRERVCEKGFERRKWVWTRDVQGIICFFTFFNAVLEGKIGRLVDGSKGISRSEEKKETCLDQGLM